MAPSGEWIESLKGYIPDFGAKTEKAEFEILAKKVEKIEIFMKFFENFEKNFEIFFENFWKKFFLKPLLQPQLS